MKTSQLLGRKRNKRRKKDAPASTTPFEAEEAPATAPSPPPEPKSSELIAPIDSSVDQQQRIDEPQNHGSNVADGRRSNNNDEVQPGAVAVSLGGVTVRRQGRPTPSMLIDEENSTVVPNAEGNEEATQQQQVPVVAHLVADEEEGPNGTYWQKLFQNLEQRNKRDRWVFGMVLVIVVILAIVGVVLGVVLTNGGRGGSQQTSPSQSPTDGILVEASPPTQPPTRSNTNTPTVSPSMGSPSQQPTSSCDIVLCPDGHQCENGGICVDNPARDGSYICDCTESPCNGVNHDGLYCEHAATAVCGFYPWFCTNGGTCGRDGSCDCPTGYAGERCQIISGTTR